MNNLSTIIVIAAVLSVPVSIWAIVYFSARIITQNRIRRDLGDMPSAEELHAWYEQNNSVLPYFHMEKRSRSGRKNENPS